MAILRQHCGWLYAQSRLASRKFFALAEHRHHPIDSMLNVTAYLRRINYAGPAAPTLETLREIHRAHLFAVPFENLDIHVGRKIVCEEDAFLHKIISEHRGDFLRTQWSLCGSPSCARIPGNTALRTGRSFRVLPIFPTAQRARWAKVRERATVPTPKRTMSASSHRRIGAAQRARWAKFRKSRW
jgi:hypothetical protein